MNRVRVIRIEDLSPESIAKLGLTDADLGRAQRERERREVFDDAVVAGRKLVRRTTPIKELGPAFDKLPPAGRKDFYIVIEAAERMLGDISSRHRPQDHRLDREGKRGDPMWGFAIWSTLNAYLDFLRECHFGERPWKWSWSERKGREIVHVNPRLWSMIETYWGKQVLKAVDPQRRGSLNDGTSKELQYVAELRDEHHPSEELDCSWLDWAEAKEAMKTIPDPVDRMLLEAGYLMAHEPEELRARSEFPTPSELADLLHPEEENRWLIAWELTRFFSPRGAHHICPMEIEPRLRRSGRWFELYRNNHGDMSQVKMTSRRFGNLWVGPPRGMGREACEWGGDAWREPAPDEAVPGA